ncbi:hypothetical protein EAE96_003528 [Botrytis aclada]|nr:hypothetical protein EAE96_003528 [Botrytis aclada]
MVEHSYQKVGLLEENRDESIEEAQKVVQRSGLKYWICKFSPYFTFHLVLLALYTLITFLITRHFKIEPLQNTAGRRLTYSPAGNSIQYEKYVFNAAPNLTSPYVGKSRPSLDQAWHDLLKHTNMRISADELAKVDRDSIPLGHGGGYYGEIAVFHELHCLKFIRQAFHMDYYSHIYGEKEKETMGEHTEHCIEILRQSVMCRGDTTLITFHWGHTVKLPQPDFTQEHTCVNWDSLMKWAEPRSIDIFEEGMLVHPTLGPAYPGGIREDRPHAKDVTSMSNL